MRRIGTVVALLVLLFARTMPAAAQTLDAEQPWDAGAPVTLFDGRSLEHWVLEIVGRDQRVVSSDTLPVTIDGAVRVTPNDGWLHTKSPYRDYRSRLGYRAADDAHAGLYFRTWRRLDRNGTPTNGYEVVLAAGHKSRLAGRIVAHGRKAQVVEFNERYARNLSARGNEWRQVAIECRGDRVEVTIDGTIVSVLTGIENPVGLVGLRGEKGQVDLRDIVLTPLTTPPSASARLKGVPRDEMKQFEMPRLVREVKPQYTADAMREGITGAVWLAVVVREDGTVGDMEVTHSLDPEYGLDEQAMTAVRQWRFQPATKYGAPVPMVVTVEMTFTLK